jgi:hypothetical protein
MGCRGRCTRPVAAVRACSVVVGVAPVSLMDPDHPDYSNDDPTQYQGFHRCRICLRPDDAHDETEWLDCFEARRRGEDS